MAAKHWIKGAIKHPGALHKQLGVPQGQKIPAKKLHAAAAKGGTLGKRARLAETLGKMHHGSPHDAQMPMDGDGQSMLGHLEDDATHHQMDGYGHHSAQHDGHGHHASTVHHTVNLHFHGKGGKKFSL